MKRSPQRPGDPDQGAAGVSSPTGVAPRTWLQRHATLRPDLRAALALEAAGELLEAARVLEYAGEFGRAALLRVELGRTLRDRGERLDVLREGCARQQGHTEHSPLLHLALAEALLHEVDAGADAASRRGFQLEAARALELAGEAVRAGELYESLGLLGRAAKAYEQGGEIPRLELVLAILDHHEAHLALLRRHEREIEEALVEGRRSHAHALLLEHTRASQAPGGDHPLPQLMTQLQALERRILAGDKLTLRWGPDQVTAICGAAGFGMGRAPELPLVLPQPGLSRHHVELRLDARHERTQLVALDLGSRAGTFWQGEPLDPEDPVVLDEPGTLALGSQAEVRVTPILGRDGHHRGAVVQVIGTPGYHVYLPQGGPLVLAPGISVPAQVLFDRGYVVLDFASGVHARLDEHPLAPGAAIELLRGDRISLRDVPLCMEVLA